MNADKLKFLKIFIGFFVILDILAWCLIFYPSVEENLQIYFLDVGQGDSSLILLPGGAKMLIDGGPPDGRLQANLERILPINDRYIDLVFISHPQLDHTGGFIKLFKNYKIGAVFTSDQVSESAAWQELEKVIKENKIPRIILSAGDKIKYRDSYFDILSPRTGGWAKDINDFGIAGLLHSSGIKSFFGADISAEKEKELANMYDIDVDVLKVSHHGSKFSSGSAFLKEATPKISVVSAGAKNTYGHPTQEALGRLAGIGAKIYRTDKNGLVKLIVDSDKLRIYTDR